MQLIPYGIVAENTYTYTHTHTNLSELGQKKGKLSKSQKTEGLNLPLEHQKYSYFNTVEEHAPTFYGCGHNANFDVDFVQDDTALKSQLLPHQ